VRLRFLDAARCLAMVMMVLAHVRDGLISPEGNAHWLMRLHDSTRGFTAPLFFIVSGWALATVTWPRWSRFQRWTPELRARLERIALLFIIGKLLTLPWWHPGFPVDVPAEVWLPFTTSGVLECLALAMLVAHACIALMPPRAFAGVCLALAAAAALLERPLQSATAAWPMLLRGPFNNDGVWGGFPIAASGGYFWLGAALGVLYAFRPWSAATTLAVGAGLLAAKGQLFITRAGVALAVLGVLALVVSSAPQHGVVDRLSRRALTFYVGHMVLLWGVPFVPGLVFLSQRGLGPGGVLGVTVAMLAGLSAACLLVLDREARKPELQRAGG